MTNYNQPSLNYFVEYPRDYYSDASRGNALSALFHSKTFDSAKDMAIPLAQYLGEQGSDLSIAMSTLDGSTADAISVLNSYGVKPVGWVVLEDEYSSGNRQGYWTNKTNVEATKYRTEKTIDWAESYRIELGGIGFDLEKPFEYVKALATKSLVNVLKAHREYRNALSEIDPSHDPVKSLARFINDLKSSGLNTQVYCMPRGLKRVSGDFSRKEIDELGSDEIIEMAYTSTESDMLVKRARLFKLLWSKDTIPAIGLLSGVEGQTPGRNFGGDTPDHLDIHQLLEHLEAIKKSSTPPEKVYLFALNHPNVARLADTALRLCMMNQTPKSRQ